MLVAFDELFKQLGTTASVDGLIVPMSSMLRLLFVMFISGGLAGFGMFLNSACIARVTAAQMAQYKSKYLKAILRQDVGWYDTSNPEQLSTTFAECMGTMQKGFKSIPMIFTGLTCTP